MAKNDQGFLFPAFKYLHKIKTRGGRACFYPEDANGTKKQHRGNCLKAEIHVSAH